MSYLYSQGNRLDDPHRYMYTQFEGVDLLRSYQASRMDVVRRIGIDYGGGGVGFDSTILDLSLPFLGELVCEGIGESSKIFQDLLSSRSVECEGAKSEVNFELEKLAKSLGRFTDEDSVITLDLLHALIAAQLTDLDGDNTKMWLDRLIQRYEVTKKLYEFYPLGFRKGEGDSRLIRLYWLFSLALCLFYCRTHEIKYLSTLLKICDLLCSLPEELLQDCIPKYGLSAVLATEIVSVQLLAAQKGVLYAS